MNENVISAGENQIILKKFYEVMLSGTIYADTLKSNVIACHTALEQRVERKKLEKNLKDLDKKLTRLEVANTPNYKKRSLKHKSGHGEVIELF